MERRPVLCVCKDPGGMNGLVPVYKKLVKMGIDAVLIANGKAIELLTSSAEKINFRTFDSADAVLAEFSNPSALVTSMCSNDGGRNLGRELIPKLLGVCLSIGLNDYWGASLSERIWGPASMRPDYIVVNDEIGAECVRKAWTMNGDDEQRIQKLGYPALDEFVNFDKVKLRAEAGAELGIKECERVVLFCGGGTYTGKVMMAVARAMILASSTTMPLTLVPREHPRMRNNFLEEVPEWDKALYGFDFESRRLIAGSSVAKVSIGKLLSRADLMINDFSTVAITASVLRVPNISYFNSDLEAYFKNSTGGLMEVPPVVSLGCSEIARHVTDLEMLIKKNFLYGLGLEEAQHKAFKVDGKNAERVAEFVKSVMVS